MATILSIIIPCYNSEATLEETLRSVIEQEFQDWEAIMVNDGSPDNLESIALQWVEKDTRFRYYKKENGGLGSARNYGIERAKGKYILPLDSDNKIKQHFSKKAVSILEQNPKVGVVYGDAEYFGEKEGEWRVATFSLDKMLLQNYIDACAIYRKSLWEDVGGYDIAMPYQGNEDWELWLAFGDKKVIFHHIYQPTFDYRVSGNSMIKTFSPEMFRANKEYIRKKYSHQYFAHFKKHYSLLEKYNSNPLKASLFYFKKWLKTLF